MDNVVVSVEQQSDSFGGRVVRASYRMCGHFATYRALGIGPNGEFVFHIPSTCVTCNPPMLVLLDQSGRLSNFGLVTQPQASAAQPEPAHPG
jgi:hypothetical protein